MTYLNKTRRNKTKIGKIKILHSQNLHQNKDCFHLNDFRFGGEAKLKELLDLVDFVCCVKSYFLVNFYRFVCNIAVCSTYSFQHDDETKPEDPQTKGKHSHMKFGVF